MNLKLLSVHADIRKCTKCDVLVSTRKNVVVGYGNDKANLMVIGEAPGANEDRQGVPFIGKSGKILEMALRYSIQIEKSETFITNVLKCRPPKNRNPSDIEVASCLPFLQQQIECIKPQVILTVGSFAARAILNTEDHITQLREDVHIYQTIPVISTFHPMFTQYNKKAKRLFIEDCRKIKEFL